MMGKVAVAGISLILVVGVIIGVVATVSRGNGSEQSVGGISTGMKAVEALCAPADYKDACVKTLSPIAEKNNNATPKDLIQATFEAALEEVSKALNLSSSSKKDAKDAYNQLGMDTCKELLDLSVDELDAAINKLSHAELHTLGELGADLKNWLSTVISYSSDCVEYINQPDLKKVMEDGLKSTNQLSINALAIVDEVSSMLSKINISSISIPKKLEDNARTLVEGFPSWVQGSDRKLLQARNNQIRPNAVVAKDGSGQFKTINEAIAAYPKGLRGRYVIYVKAGVYHEYVLIPKQMTNIMIYGDGPRRTVITGDHDVARKGFNTMTSATFGVVGNGFIAKSITFQNTAGPDGEQAVALRSQSDMSVFYNCRIDGYQDSLYYHAGRQFYRNCVISGTVDFIFGKGTALIQNSKILLRLGRPGSKNTVTADGRENARMPTGLVIQNCRIIPEARLVPQKTAFPSYLGRPWKAFSRTMVMESSLSVAIRPEGWLLWDGEKNDQTCEYREFANKGMGANPARRVRWGNTRVITDRREAEKYTAGIFLFDSGRWVRDANVPHHLGLTPA